MSKREFLLLCVAFLCIVVGLSAQTPAPAPQPAAPARPAALPGRVPMDACLLACSAEWNAYYDVVPEGERKLYWNVGKVLLPVLTEAVGQMKGLNDRLTAVEAKVKALEAAAKPAEPNQPNGGAK